jgi:putative sugar O-methyltransferase
VGSYKWSKTWVAIQKELDQPVPLAKFRQNDRIKSRIETPLGKVRFTQWKDRCKEAGVPEEWCVDTMIGNPFYEVQDGKKYTSNSFRFAYQAYRIFSLRDMTKPTSVLEVGAGYGGLADVIMRYGNVSKYYLIDAPPMLKLQEYYLTEAGHGDKIVLREPNVTDLAALGAEEKLDLIISINSLGEMDTDVVNNYIKLFQRTLKPETGLFFLIQRREAEGGHLYTAWKQYEFEDIWELEEQPEWVDCNWVVCGCKLKCII